MSDLSGTNCSLPDDSRSNAHEWPRLRPSAVWTSNTVFWLVTVLAVRMIVLGTGVPSPNLHGKMQDFLYPSYNEQPMGKTLQFDGEGFT